MKQARPTRPLVSIIVLNFNGGTTTLHCIESILEQHYNNQEVILVDNASTDKSDQLVEKSFPTVKIVRNPKNLGFAEGNNQGILASKGELVLLANNDVILDKDAVTSLVHTYQETPGVTGGLLYYSGTRRIWAYGARFDPFTGIHWQIHQGDENAGNLPRTLKVDYVPGAMLLTSRSFLDRIGLLDNYFFLYGDDIDLAIKAQRLGLSVTVTSTATANHYVSQTVRKLERAQQQEFSGYYLMNRNMFYIYFTQLPVPYMLTSTFFQLGLSFFEILLFKRPLKYIRWKLLALTDIFRNPLKIWRKRKTVMHLGKFRSKSQLFQVVKLARKRGLARTYYW